MPDTLDLSAPLSRLSPAAQQLLAHDTEAAGKQYIVARQQELNAGPLFPLISQDEAWGDLLQTHLARAEMILRNEMAGTGPTMPALTEIVFCLRLLRVKQRGGLTPTHG